MITLRRIGLLMLSMALSMIGAAPAAAESELEPKRPWRHAVAMSLLLVACSSKPETEQAPPAAEPGTLRIGTVMMENGRRFETAGRAARAGRWELAAYEAGEMLELFEEDMARAPLPGDCEDEIADRVYFTLRDEQIGALRDAARARDQARFDTAFAAAATSCNGCHAACQSPFIQVPSHPGEGIPQLDPVPAP